MCGPIANASVVLGIGIADCRVSARAIIKLIQRKHTSGFVVALATLAQRTILPIKGGEEQRNAKLSKLNTRTVTILNADNVMQPPPHGGGGDGKKQLW